MYFQYMSRTNELFSYIKLVNHKLILIPAMAFPQAGKLRHGKEEELACSQGQEVANLT